ncbi:hypothetical protein COK43_02610 [Bacillus cereus]|nr:hypothetical protein COK43_02610 [Bacillus cereus]
MRQADLVKIINKKYGLKISQKVIKERIDKIYTFIKNQFISNRSQFNDNEVVFFGVCIRNIERKNFNQYTGAIFLSFLSLYKKSELFRSMLKGNIVDDDYLEDLITYFEEFMDRYICVISSVDKTKEKVNYLIKNEKKILEKYEADFPYFMFIVKGFIKKIFTNESIINTKIIDQIRHTESLLKKADELSTYRHYLFIKKLNRKIELLLEKEKFLLKEELRDAIISHDIDKISCIIPNLDFYPNFIEDKNHDVKILEDLESGLKSRYKLNLKELFQIGDFKNKILKYKAKERMEIIQRVQKTIDSKGKREIFSFIEKINNADDKRVEGKREQIQEEYEITKKLILHAGRLKSITEMKRILEKRVEYKHLEKNDKQMYNAIEDLMKKALTEDDQKLLLAIDSILKYYKKFFM